MFAPRIQIIVSCVVFQTGIKKGGNTVWKQVESIYSYWIDASHLQHHSVISVFDVLLEKKLHNKFCFNSRISSQKKNILLAEKLLFQNIARTICTICGLNKIPPSKPRDITKKQSRDWTEEAPKKMAPKMLLVRFSCNKNQENLMTLKRMFPGATSAPGSWSIHSRLAKY